MKITDAIKLVAADFYENERFTDGDAVVCIRSANVTDEQLQRIDDDGLREAYAMIVQADENDLAAALHV